MKPSSAASVQAPSNRAIHSSDRNGGSSATAPNVGPVGARQSTTAWRTPPAISFSICSRSRSRVTVAPDHHQIGSGP